MGAPDINACDQTPEGLSKHMFEEETFERWSVIDPILDLHVLVVWSLYFNLIPLR